MMGRIMPIFLGFISLSIPAGVLVYWVTTNGWQVGQQYVMLRTREAAEREAESRRRLGRVATEAVEPEEKGPAQKQEEKQQQKPQQRGKQPQEKAGPKGGSRQRKGKRARSRKKRRKR
jgi:YidC/Oxa1 family membrane protein insertase